ncbi:MAG: dihydroorotate dehydrogenase-like protein [Acidobacteria bacterium]|nr:dihydroorotate dehydrogenase-like protein [Acidobacteriota bacterium]
MVDLSTTYLGLHLANPIVPSSSPLMKKVDNIRRMQDAGAAAVVLHSLFEEQITRESQELDRYLNHGTESFAEALSYFPDLISYNLGPEGYLEHIERVKAAVSIPVIGSLNGVSSGGWINYARKIEEAGADALELNIYYVAADTDQHSLDVEKMYLDLVEDVKGSVRIPLAVKLGHHFSAFANFAKQLSQAGADGLVLFNRFYQPEFDLNSLEVVPNLDLSNSTELRLRLRWVAILYERIGADLAVTGGVHTAEDVLRSMMAGANISMVTSVLLERGIGHLKTLLSDLVRWMEEREYDSIQQMRGSMSHRAIAQPAALERANYMKVLLS